MSPSRRDFLKTTAIASTGMALSHRAFAASVAPEQAAPAAASAAANAATFTRGIGLYPGAHAENFDPELILDTSGAYRNLALLRPAFHSSAYDYNLTAQLVTDGIADTHLPDWITTVVNERILPKHQREFLTNHSPEALVDLAGEKSSVELHLGGRVRSRDRPHQSFPRRPQHGEARGPRLHRLCFRRRPHLEAGRHSPWRADSSGGKLSARHDPRFPHPRSVDPARPAVSQPPLPHRVQLHRPQHGCRTSPPNLDKSSSTVPPIAYKSAAPTASPAHG